VGLPSTAVTDSGAATLSACTKPRWRYLFCRIYAFVAVLVWAVLCGASVVFLLAGNSRFFIYCVAWLPVALPAIAMILSWCAFP
jgi:hypothetical protein